MEIKTFTEKKVTGFKVRTKNSNEMNLETAQIGNLWEKFFTEIAKNLNPESKVYGVYTNYESDANGEFDVFAASDKFERDTIENLETITIVEGKYLVFTKTGEMPKVVIEAWQDIWEYFADTDCKHVRKYQTDFEFYKNEKEVEVYIGIN